MAWRDEEKDDGSTQGESQVALFWVGAVIYLKVLLIVLLLGGPSIAIMRQCRHLLKETVVPQHSTPSASLMQGEAADCHTLYVAWNDWGD